MAASGDGRVRSVIAECSVLTDEPMSRHTTFGIGGPAQFFSTAISMESLVALARWARSEGIDYRVIGSGANLLVNDAGVRGLVIVNRAASCRLSTTTGKLHAGSGALLSDLALYTAVTGWSGLEWAVGIPGSLGGAIVGNAGAFGGYMENVIIGVDVLAAQGELRRLDHSECGFAYRSSCFKMPAGTGHSEPIASAVILEAELLLQRGEHQELQDRVAGYVARRAAAQPDEPSAGSIFKRTSDQAAGWLIEQVGLKGRRIGGAVISPRHGNFIVNLGGATSADVLALIALGKSKVKEHFGLELELEIELV